MDTQLQIRQNALEAQDYMKELMDWSQTMKQKAGSKAGKQQTDQGVPAVRGKADGCVQIVPEDLQRPCMQPSASSAATKPPAAAHTYTHYSKWDSFDEDAASDDEGHPAEIKQQSYAASRHQPQHAAPPQLPPPAAAPVNGSRKPAAGQTPKATEPAAPSATSLKDRGNKLFQAGYFEDAIKCYTKSIGLQPTSITYANRAMAHLKVSRFAEAEHDCDEALQLDSTYIKALHRRGTARKQLGKLLEAAADFEEALRLEPANTTVQADRDSALEQYLQQQNIQPDLAWSSIPVVARQQQQLQQPSLQMTHNEFQPARTTSPAAAAPQQPTAVEPMPATDNNRCLLSSSGAVPSATDHNMNSAVNIVEASSSSSSSPAARPHPSRSSSPQQSSTAAAAAAAAAQLAARLAASLKAPRTSNEFEAAWRSFKGDRQLQAKYLALVPPQQLPAIFKTSLTAPILSAVLQTALEAAAATPSSQAAVAGSAGANSACAADGSGLTAAHAVALVDHMVSVPRFDMTAMCLTGKDKPALRRLWDAAVAVCDAHLAERLAAARPKYRL